MFEKLKASLAEYLKPYVLILAMGAGAVIWIQYQMLKNARIEAAAKDAIVNTLAQDFKEFKKSSVEEAKMFNSALEAQKTAYDRFGPDVIAYMKQNHGDLQAIHDAVGRVDASVGNVSWKVSSLPDGTYSGTLPQIRPDQKGGTLPPLTAVKLDFNPATKDLKQAWQNNEEEFDFSLGTWKLDKGGYTSAVTGKRLIYKPGPNGERALVGEEPIAFKSGVATFTEKTFKPDDSVLTISPWTISMGIGKEDLGSMTASKTVPALGIDYRFSNRVGLGATIIGKSGAVMLSWRPKKR
jgi:hypothetical protein